MQVCELISSKTGTNRPLPCADRALTLDLFHAADFHVQFLQIKKNTARILQKHSPLLHESRQYPVPFLFCFPITSRSKQPAYAFAIHSRPCRLQYSYAATTGSVTANTASGCSPGRRSFFWYPVAVSSTIHSM